MTTTDQSSINLSIEPCDQLYVTNYLIVGSFTLSFSLQNPVIISGGGVVMGAGVDAVVQLAEALKARNILTSSLWNDSDVME